MTDYGANCFQGCGRLAVILEIIGRYCPRCWMWRFAGVRLP